MHETVFANRIIEEAKKHGKVISLHLELGQLAHIPPNDLLECMARLVDWDIIAKEVPAKVKCICGFKGSPKILERGHDCFLIECPKCKQIPELIDGKDIKIVKVIVK